MKQGANDFVAKECSSGSAYIGTFYICYSKNLTDLKKLNVDDEHCCYCSKEALTSCSQRFPNWKLHLEEGDKSCHVTLQEVTENDSGYYQCRVYDVANYPCKRRYGNIYNYSVSTSNHSLSNQSPFSVSTIILIAVISGVTGILIIIVILTIVIIKLYRKRTRYHQSK